MLGLLAQPKVQNADDAVVTLCDRLSNSLLLEDRKAAVLALRGLSHENRELVASTGLKGLLNTLVKDSFDPGAAKATLETLLILFNTDTRRKVRNKRFVSPLLKKAGPPSEDESARVASDISLWLTDQLLHNEEALQRVLELASTKNDAFTAVYALQLVSVMTANRPMETKRILLSLGGVAPLVSALGSAQEMVRDEALLLVSALTTDHIELQKLVAFEGGFDLALQILLESGGAVYGGRFAEDSLRLVANLIEYNYSNQKLFAETGNIKQWTQILESIVDAQNEGSINPAIFYKEQVMANIDAALQIGQLLCLPGAERTETNQNLLSESGAFTLTLQIAFGANSPPSVRVSALLTAAAMIDNNVARQHDFLGTDVPLYEFNTVRGSHASNPEPLVVPVSQALLNWCIALNSSHFFDLRCASMVCLRSAMTNNLEAKTTFVNEQIEQYQTVNTGATPNGGGASSDGTTDTEKGRGQDEDKSSGQLVNLIEVLAEYSEHTRLNPFRIWFASAILMHLFDDAPIIKEILSSVTVGDASLGMEVQRLVQALAGEMQGALQTTDASSEIMREPTVVLGYLQLLTVWLYDDMPAVNDFLVETSTVRSLLAQHQSANPLVATISVVLLGVAYAFCSRNSPLPRTDFHELLTQTLGRDQYLSSIRKLRQSPVYFNYDEGDIFGAPRTENGFPAVFLDSSFVNLLRDGLSHISRVIDLDPRVEPASKITFEMVDEAKQALFAKTEALQKVESQLKETLEAKEKLEVQLKESLSKVTESSESTKTHVEKLQKAESDLRDIQAKATSLETQLESAKSELSKEKSALESLQDGHKKLDTEYTSVKAAKEKAENGINNMTRELFQLQRQKESFEKENGRIQSELSKLKPKLESSMKSETTLKDQLKELRAKHESEVQSSGKLRDTNDKLVAKLKETASFLTEREEEEEELRSELSKLKIKAESQENEFRSLKNREALNRKELEAKNHELETVKNELVAVKKDFDAAQKSVAQLQADLAKKAENEGSESQSLRLELDETRSQLKTMQLEAEKLKESVAKSNEQFQKIKAENEKLAKEVSQLGAKLAAVSEENSKLGAENKKLDEEKSKLSQEALKLDKANAKLGQEKTKLDDEKAQLLEEKTHLNKEFDQVREEKAKLSAENSKLVSEKATADAKNESSSEESAAAAKASIAEQIAEAEKAAQGKLDQATKSNDQLKEVNMKLMKELAALKKAQSGTPQNGIKKSSEMADKDSQAIISKLNKDLKEKQNDLDELMVLLEDLSEKKSSYKNRLRQIDGESVSDSDEDDDEDDEDDEE